MKKTILACAAVALMTACTSAPDAEKNIEETTTTEAMEKNLFIVDPQNGFMDTGSLPVAGSQARMDSLASYLNALPLDYYDQILVSLDWHTVNHSSFAEYGGPWPEHCVAFTTGALVTEPLMTELLRWMKEDKVKFILKGQLKEKDEYSSLDNEENAAFFKKALANTKTLDVCGVVGTVCVQNTIKGLIEKEAIASSKINVLYQYTAQFDDKAEAEFVAWCNDNIK